MKCPHCTVEINSAFAENYIGKDRDGYFSTFIMKCPNMECQRFIVQIGQGDDTWTSIATHETRLRTDTASGIVYRTVRPVATNRPIPPEVKGSYKEDFEQACLTLPFSPKASAALSRRCLQNILRDKAAVKHSDLSKEIDEVLASNKLPSHLAESIDAVRNLGNFAAHPIKSQHTSEIVDVEPGEAEWSLDVLEGLFDFYFVQPAVLAAKKAALNKKLAEAKKPPLK